MESINENLLDEKSRYKIITVWTETGIEYVIVKVITKTDEQKTAKEIIKTFEK